MTDYHEAVLTVKVADLTDVLTLSAGGMLLSSLTGNDGPGSELLIAAFERIAEVVDELMLNEVDPATIPEEIGIVFESRRRVLAGESDETVDAWAVDEYTKLREQRSTS